MPDTCNPNPSDINIARTLVHQVRRAIPKPWGSELDVVTYITRPMWNAFLRGVEVPEDTPPQNWTDIPNGLPLCVNGSLTIVVESDRMEAFSVARKLK